jgi:serine phosphatase RsbU (regulator of sigma subunit)
MLASLIYTRTRVKSKANRILQTQNNLIAKQKDEITDSIAYAQNIQQSMLPSRETLARNLPEYFILYKPKDIVSGDFYFFEKTGSKLILSAVDCTGHGVPGALLSFLGMDILQEAVHRKGIINPAGLLQYLDAEINRRLRKTAAEGSIRDGMDLAICTIDLESRKLEFAGAFNPIYIVSEGVLEEIKPDKLAIGSGQEGAGLSFKCHTRQLKKGDCIYLLSDGYADQFGGPAGKKFKYKPLKELLTLNFNRTMKEQEQILEKVFVEWKGSLFQVDDILIMGIRV